MADGFKIADAYVEVSADTDKLYPGVRSALGRMDARGDGGRAGSIIGDSMADGLYGRFHATASKHLGSFFQGIAKGALLTANLVAAVGVVGSLGHVLAAAAGSAGLLPAALLVGAGALAAIKLGADGAKRAFEQLTPVLDELKANVSATFERSLKPAVNDLKGLLPQLTRGLQGVAAAVGGAASQFTAMLSRAENVAVLNQTLGASRTVVTNLGQALAPLGQAFLDVASVGTQLFAEMTSGAGSAAQGFADWIREAKESGKLREWIQNGIDALKQLWQVLKDVGAIVRTVFQAFEDAGIGVTGVFGSMVHGLREFLESAQGQEVLHALAQAVALIATNVSRVLGPAIDALAPLLPPLLEAFAAFTTQIADFLIPAIEFLAPALLGIATFIAQNIGWIGPLVIALGAWTAAQWLLNAAMSANPIGLVIIAIAALIGLVALIVENWGPITDFFAGLWTGIRDFFVNIWNNIASFAVGIWTAVTGFFRDIWTAVTSWFSNLWNGIANWFKNLWNGISSWFSGVLNGIGSFFRNIWNGVSSWFQSTINNIGSFFRNAWNGIVSFFRGIGDSISSIGRTMWDGLTSGLKGAVNFIIRILNGVVSALNVLVDGANAVNPFGDIPHIPKIPMLAKGGVATKGGAAVVGDAGPELLTMPRGAQVTPLTGGRASDAMSKAGIGGSGYSVENLYVTIDAASVEQMQGVIDFFQAVIPSSRQGVTSIAGVRA